MFPSIRVFSNELALQIRWPDIGVAASTSVLPKGLISFRTGWFDLLAVQGTVKNLLQHPSLKVSIVHHSVFLMVQLSYPYMTTGKTIVKQNH